MENTLLKFGLTENESAIYLAYISNPLKSAAEISRLIKMDKSSTYKAVENLTKHGLLIQTGYNKAFTYKAANPETLNQLYYEKKAELEVNRSSLDLLVQKLKKESIETRKTYITYETGLENLQKRLTESLECKEKIIRERWRYHSHFDNPQHVDFILNYATQRKNNNIFMRQIEPTSQQKIFRGMAKNASPRMRLGEIRNHPKKYMKEIRSIPEQLCDNNSFRIWDDYVNIISFENPTEFILITIYDKFIAEMMKNMFDFIWDQCEQYSPPEKSEPI
jgi:sugar-specific transcriptional regulator TrmB